ncbi:associated protein ECM29 homolog [Seminavis robusta]|uniref:Associated protein ECM29 homolog n=1 Tax=Seminavis robusta TaxID=568900 RepID=A0A9N8D9C8_9STRA|nr:associated protein ECM29 homolog [Seminavis robusta]|eukprot:Sro22_g015300.1 associated protein ECM29 homolog (2450) ;mRNA; f:62850-70274
MTSAAAEPPSLAERQKTAASELSSLGRVSHKLALVDSSERLQQVLEKLLPRLLKRIGDNHQQQLKLARDSADNQLRSTHDKIHAKLVEMLGHTMKRVRDDKACKLPCKDILQLLLEEETATGTSSITMSTNDQAGRIQEQATTPTVADTQSIPKAKTNVDPFTLNLALAFLTLGLPRSSTHNEVEALLPSLLALVGHYSGLAAIRTPAKKMQSNQVGHLLLRSIEWMVEDENKLSKSPLLGMNKSRKTQNEPAKDTSMTLARKVCEQDQRVAGAVFDLLLDGILYQTVAGNVPPNGLSQAGHERLKSGSSTSERDWAAEKAPSMKLMEFKLALLDFIAPSRRWAIFAASSTNTTSVSRTVALLVAATGDPNPEVAQRATTYLKMHHDSKRGSSSTEENESDPSTSSATAVGDPLRLTCGLLALALGQTNAESAMASASAGNSRNNAWLGMTPEESSSTDSSQLILSLKRRAVVESTAATIMKYVGEKILEENPHLFRQAVEVQQMATLSILVAQRTLSNLRTSSGLSALQARPFVAAAGLLNVLCVRLATFYDSVLSTDEVNEKSNTEEKLKSATLTLMARALATACFVLAPASTPVSRTSNSGVVSNDGSITIRDACYGVVCSLSRSQFVLARENYIFTRGDPNISDTSGNVSIDTASLLFGCATNEADRLRPRAVAALDALLGAYCRVFLVKDKPEERAAIVSEAPSNPWATVSDVKQSTSAGNHQSDNKERDNLSVVKSLLPLLWSASASQTAKASRVAASRWASDLIKMIDVTSACHLLVFLAGDSDVTASTIAREGLGLPSKLSIASSDDDDLLHDDASSKDDNEWLPGFGDYISIVFPATRDEKSSSAYWRPQYWDMSFSGKAAAIRFGLVCLFSDMYHGDEKSLKVFVATLADTLVLFGTKADGTSVGSKARGREAVVLLEELTRGLLATLTTSQYARNLLVTSSSADQGEVSLSLKDIEFLALTVNSSRARRHLANCCLRLYADTDLWQSTEAKDGDCTPGVETWLQRTQLLSTLQTCASKLKGIENHSGAGAVHGASFLGAQCICAFRSSANPTTQASPSEEECWKNASAIVAALGQGVLHSDDIVANSCADALAAAFAYDSLDAPILDQRMYEASASAIGNLASGLKKFSSIDHVDAPRVAKIVKAAGICLAASTSGAGVVSNSKNGSLDLGPARLTCVEALFSLLGSPAFRADEEIALAVGEALGNYADAIHSGAVWSSPDREWPKDTDYDENFARELPPHGQVLYTLLRKIYPSNSPQKRTACAPAMLGIVARACRGVNKNESYAQRSLVLEIKRQLGEIQLVFIRLLSDPKSKHLSRESCCLGLAACRGLTKSVNVEGVRDMGTEELNSRLLRAFGQTSNYGGSAYQETAQQAAQRRAAESGESGQVNTGMEQFGEGSEVGGASGLGEAALNSYKEMAAAAISLGRTDVLYALLILSISHPAWFTGSNKYKYNASSLLGEDSIVGSRTNSSELRKALRPHLGKLLPRILRATHDPQKQTRDQMSSLWVGLTGGGSESRAAITEHLLPTVDTLIEDATNKLWRARAGACGALAEILVGRSWDDLGSGKAVINDDDIHASTSRLTAGIRILRLFRVAMRALDDVRGNVREAGETLARTMRGLSIRLCTRTLKEAPDGTRLGKQAIESHERNASAASATVLRWLIKHGLNQKCAEATGICLSCLVEIIDVVQPKILQPLIPDLLLSLLLSMSSLEPSALNYLQVRSGSHDANSALSYENLERVRLRLAQSGPLAAAVTKLLGMLPSVSIETQKQVVPQLDAALRQSVGFASRAATADAVASLTQSCPNAFNFSGAGNMNPSVRLLRALYFASERERGQGARDKMIHSLGNLAALCPGSSVRVLAKKLCDKYSTATGNNDDPASRRASASALRSIAVRASNQLSDGGPGNIWARRVLPVAFLGMKDDDDKVAGLWREVWDEGSIQIDLSYASSQAGGDDGFGGTEEKLLPYLVEECCNALNGYAWLRRVAGASALVDLCNSGVLSPCPRSTSPTSNSDSYSLKRSQRRAEATNRALSTGLNLLSKSRLWTGKNEVINSVVSIAGKWNSAILDKDSTEESLFGWTGPGQCPFQPISVTLSGFGEDLFVGDGWFRLKNTVEVTVENNVEQETTDAMEVDADCSAEGQKLDFEDADKLLDSEDEGRNGNAEAATLKESRVPTFAGICLFLLDQAMPGEVSKTIADSEEFLPYRVAAFKGLRDMLASLVESETCSRGTELKKELYRSLSPNLISMCSIPHGKDSNADCSKKADEPPVLVARAIDCLGVCFWQSMGTQAEVQECPSANVLKLTTMLLAAGGEKQAAWTVREASRLCLSSLASKCHAQALRDHRVPSAIVESADQGRKDRKFWKVRLSSVKLLHSLVARAGSKAIDGKDQERQLLLESILPEKERILSISRNMLSDSEPKVTAQSASLLSLMSWWP